MLRLTRSAVFVKTMDRRYLVAGIKVARKMTSFRTGRQTLVSNSLAVAVVGGEGCVLDNLALQTRTKSLLWSGMIWDRYAQALKLCALCRCQPLEDTLRELVTIPYSLL